jgi:hypothetical protein
MSSLIDDLPRNCIDSFDIYQYCECIDRDLVGVTVSWSYKTALNNDMRTLVTVEKCYESKPSTWTVEYYSDYVSGKVAFDQAIDDNSCFMHAGPER